MSTATTLETINRLSNERQALWFAASKRYLTAKEQVRIGEITSLLPDLWDTRRRQLAGSPEILPPPFNPRHDRSKAFIVREPWRAIRTMADRKPNTTRSSHSGVIGTSPRRYLRKLPSIRATKSRCLARSNLVTVTETQPHDRQSSRPHMADGYTDATMIQQSDHIDAMNAGAACIMRAQNEQQAYRYARNIADDRPKTAVFIRDRYDAWKQGSDPGIFTTMI